MSDKLRTNKRGRPTTAELMAKRASVADVMAGVNQERMWKRFLDSMDERVAFDCWKYLNDRFYGKPKQSIRLGGDPEGEPVQHVIVVKFVRPGDVSR